MQYDAGTYTYIYIYTYMYIYTQFCLTQLQPHEHTSAYFGTCIRASGDQLRHMHTRELMYQSRRCEDAGPDQLLTVEPPTSSNVFYEISLRGAERRGLMPMKCNSLARNVDRQKWK